MKFLYRKLSVNNMKDYKVNKFLLSDNCDTFFTDLITIEKAATKEEIQNAIIKAKEKEDYTNEDIYEELDKQFNILSIVFLGNYESFDY